MTQPVTQPPPEFADPAEAARYGNYVQAQLDEYGTYVAAEVIYVGNVVAFGEGHPVPKSTVENPEHAWIRDKVRRTAPPPQIGTDRTDQLRARVEEIRQEQEAIDAELAAAAEAAKEPEPYKSMTVVDMQAELRRRELPVSGKRADLIARLVADDEAPADETVSADDEAAPAADPEA